MTIQQNKQGNVLTLILDGRLDTTTSPKFSEDLNAAMSGVTKIVLDFAKLVYLSSAGLRSLLAAQKQVGQGNLVIRNVSEPVMEVFEITGFTDILTFEK